MKYKTIVLRLLKQRPPLRDQLRQSKQLLPTMERYARELKKSHEAWKERLLLAKPQSDPEQIAAEAMELALKDLEDCLPSRLDRDDSNPLSIDQVMAHISSHTSDG